MLDQLNKAARRRGADAVSRRIGLLSETPTPPGVKVETTDKAVLLSGRNLRRRMLTDPLLRNFGR